MVRLNFTPASIEVLSFNSVLAGVGEAGNILQGQTGEVTVTVTVIALADGAVPDVSRLPRSSKALTLMV